LTLPPLDPVHAVLGIPLVTALVLVFIPWHRVAARINVLGSLLTLIAGLSLFRYDVAPALHAYRLGDLAEAFARSHGAEIVEIGARAGERTHESLVSASANQGFGPAVPGLTTGAVGEQTDVDALLADLGL